MDRVALERAAGAAVALVVGHEFASLATGMSVTHPRRHALLVIATSAVAAPLVLATSREWHGVPMQLAVAGAIAALDWFSFHEDKTRFSERPLCLLGNCRVNAMLTGALAHLGDVAGFLLLLWPATAGRARRADRLALAAAAAAYAVAGARVIHRATRAGSASDLRGRGGGACREARIMRDAWRGGLNDLITVLGVVAVWQPLADCARDPECAAGYALPGRLPSPAAAARPSSRSPPPSSPPTPTTSTPPRSTASCARPTTGCPTVRRPAGRRGGARREGGSGVSAGRPDGKGGRRRGR